MIILFMKTKVITGHYKIGNMNKNINLPNLSLTTVNIVMYFCIFSKINILEFTWISFSFKNLGHTRNIISYKLF